MQLYVNNVMWATISPTITKRATQTDVCVTTELKQTALVVQFAPQTVRAFVRYVTPATIKTVATTVISENVHARTVPERRVKTAQTLLTELQKNARHVTMGTR